MISKTNKNIKWEKRLSKNNKIKTSKKEINQSIKDLIRKLKNN